MEIQRFLRDREQETGGEVLPPDAARRLATHVRFMTNFELHRRKIFWVDESGIYVGEDRPGRAGRDVRAPFPCFALVFTDRHTLSLAERMCIPLAEHTQVARFLEDLAPLVMADPPVRDAHPLRGLLHIILNAILYAVSAGVEPELRRKPQEREPLMTPGPAPLVFSSENVYFLPGKIEISRVRHFQELERVETGRRASSIALWYAATGAVRRPTGQTSACGGLNRIGRDPTSPQSSNANTD